MTVPRVGVAAIFKNEFEYILEWIAYHQLIGVDHFYIADNVSSDYSSELLEALDAMGVITRVYFPRVGDQGPQAGAYNKILTEFGGQVDLMAFIDADEFIVSTNEKSLKEHLQPFFESESAGAMALNWRNYGSSGHVLQDCGPVLSRFTRCSEQHHDFNRHIKTILKPAKTKRMNIHECELVAGRYVMADMSPAEFEGDVDFGPKTKTVSYPGLRINHYVVKSKQEHIVKKDRKGSGAGSAARRKGVGYFRGHDLNSVEDKSMLDFVPGVIDRVNSLRARLVAESPFMSFGGGHVDVNADVISGWVTSEVDVPLSVKVLVNGLEYVVPATRERPDVVRKGLSNRLRCGFWFKHQRPLTPDDKVDVSIFGSLADCKVNFVEQ
ncbi:hypothetical protein Mag101_04300 [Microbulbifer agarilyticus]|uniref:Glycosyl transferase family 2 n=1 Tax=Microbulbifer agarilyticus TaxID=260552 RepID=A0A1Q2M2J9_9GAMM|nr:glycosyltransferase family 92 protein [Microbulbifer agarilyticus]AQQ66944.1 hypothetical protein Mag101_04300 [Microbulbifer agarilyticus]